MSTIDQFSPRAFRFYVTQKLASEESFRQLMLEHILAQLSPTTRFALDNAVLRFAYIPESEPFVLVQYGPKVATIAHAAYWQSLEALCCQVVMTTGISRLQSWAVI